MTQLEKNGYFVNCNYDDIMKFINSNNTELNKIIHYVGIDQLYYVISLNDSKYVGIKINESDMKKLSKNKSKLTGQFSSAQLYMTLLKVNGLIFINQSIN